MKLYSNFNSSTTVFPQTLKQISISDGLFYSTDGLKGFKIPFGCLIKKISEEKMKKYKWLPDIFF